MRRWFWIPAALVAIAGSASLIEAEHITDFGVLIFAIPYLVAVVITAYAGRMNTVSTAVAFMGTCAMAGVSWWEATERMTEGFEWEFHNDLGFVCFCVFNYLMAIMLVTLVLALTLQETETPPPA